MRRSETLPPDWRLGYRLPYQALDLHGGRYDKIECDEPGLSRLVDSMGPEWAGLSLTTPLKRVALDVVYAPWPTSFAGAALAAAVAARQG